MKRTLVVLVIGAVAIAGAILFKRGEHDSTVKDQMLDLVRQIRVDDLDRRYVEAQVERFHSEVFAASTQGIDRSQFNREAYTRAMFDRLIAEARDASKVSLAMKLERFEQSLRADAAPSGDADDEDDIESAWACRSCGAGWMFTSQQLDALAAKTKELLAKPVEGEAPKPFTGRALLCEKCQAVAVNPAMRCTRCSTVYLPKSNELRGICEKCAVTYWICRNASCRHEFQLPLGELYKTGRHEGPARCPKCSGTDTVLGYRCAKCGRNYPPAGHDQPATCPHCGASTVNTGRGAKPGQAP